MTAGQIGTAPVAANHDLPAQVATPSNVVEDEDEEELERMQSRLEALRS